MRKFIGLLVLGCCAGSFIVAQGVGSHVAPGGDSAGARSAEYAKVQERLARGWNTWDVHSVATQVLLPEGLAIHVGMKHNSTLNGDAFLGDALIGSFGADAPVVTPGPHAWDGSYTRADCEWKGHKWRVESAHDGDDLVMLVTALENKNALPPTVVFSVSGSTHYTRYGPFSDGEGEIHIPTDVDAVVDLDCTCSPSSSRGALSVSPPYFAADLREPVGISTSYHGVTRQGSLHRRTLAEIQTVISREKKRYEKSILAAGANGPILDAIETTLGWDTIYDPEKQRVISPVSRVWSVGWGGYVLFDWDTFFAATMASIGDKDLAYANALEILREETEQGFVPNYARAGNWKSADRSEPPVGAITALGLYRKFHERWFIEDAFEPLLKWNRWWAEHRDIQGYLEWGSDGQNQPENLDDRSRGTREGAILESGLDNSPMYDDAIYNAQSHVLEYADVGLMSMYIADCDALAEIADALGKTEAKELRDRAAKYRAKLATLWDEKAGIFLNKDLHTGELNRRLSPTNFYPMLAKAATPEQARTMIEKHLRNPKEFWGQWIIPSIERNDPAFKDQNYWRGRIWGPMNYLVYLGLENYDDAVVRKEFADQSYELFVKEWREKGHVHENYNAITGTGDDVTSSDRFYHWGALLGYVEYLEQSEVRSPNK
jgi:neutral trehalase